MALSPTSSRGSSGSSLPSQWATDSSGGLTITQTGAAHHGDYANALTVVNADGNPVFYLDSSGTLLNYIRDQFATTLIAYLPTGFTGGAGSVAMGVYTFDPNYYPWWIDAVDLTEAVHAITAPLDANIAASTAKSWYDATNGAARFVRRGKTADGTVVQTNAPMAPPITSGALPTATLVSGTGAQIALNRDARTVTPVTFNPTGAATATCLVQLSPDNVTYSTLVTKTFPVSVTLAGSIDEVSAIVPAGWYLKLTATNATLGTTTYY